MKCPSCNWFGSRGDLLFNNSENVINLFDWCLCPNCSFSFHLNSDISLSQQQDSVLHINSQLSNTYVHLGRILNFKIEPHKLILTVYKRPRVFFDNSREINLTIPCSIEFESKILLKIIYLLHKNKYKCESKEYESMMLFGKWKPYDDIFPKIKCSFCARIYEFENNAINGWPLSTKKIEEESLNYICRLAKVPIYKGNRKFSLIFSEIEEKVEEVKICWCNEISPYPNPNCFLHKKMGSDRIERTTA